MLGPSMSCVFYFPMRGIPGKKGKHTADKCPYRHEMMMRNMAKTGLKRNGGQGLHAGLVGMPVTSLLFQRTHCIFSLCWFL